MTSINHLDGLITEKQVCVEACTHTCFSDFLLHRRTSLNFDIIKIVIKFEPLGSGYSIIRNQFRNFAKGGG